MSDSANRLLDDPPDVERASTPREPAPRSPGTLEKPKRSSFSFIASIRSSFTVAGKDIRSIPRYKSSKLRRLLWEFLASITIVSLLIALFFLTFRVNLQSTDPCGPDGDFRLKTDQDDYFIYNSNLWALSGFFEVTLGWGEFDFTTAKLIDVAWDLVIGRGGQAIMSLIAWRVFTEYLEVSLATKPATYTTVWLLRFHQDTSVLSSIRLFSQFFRRGLASKLAMWIMALTLSFILAFPTIAGSMTGYTAFNDLYITSSDDRLFPFNSVRPIAYVVHDGDRTANFTKDYIVPWRSGITYARSGRKMMFWDFCFGYNETWYDGTCDLQRNVSYYIQQYGFNSPGNERTRSGDNMTEFCGETIDGPPLNISAYYLPDDFYWRSNSSKNATIKTNPYPDRTKMLFTVDNDMYNLTQLFDNGVCQPAKDKDAVQRYQWGFSFLQLYIVTILLLLWSLALVALWKTSHDMLKLNHRETTSQDWKGLLDLTDKIRMQVDQAGIDIDSLSDKQLEYEIQEVLQGGSISSPQLPKGYFNVCRWLWRKKWWFILVILTLVLFVSEHQRPRVPSTPATLGPELQRNILQFALPYTAICLSAAFAFGSSLLQKVVVFVLACGLCIPLFFYETSFRDFVLPGTFFGFFLAFGIGSTKGSRFVLFSVPFLCNYIVIFVLHFHSIAVQPTFNYTIELYDDI
ncbi:hypothetical protein FPOA_03415 [Fusarium poae]|uniref:Uncharacterized protein n=1 Tax=Fusarium poae TaxID=36050 RepID=A0A1B8B9V4_FUSPO|nr:hypothetical protein FPOA_03415 [Fusarium poae]